jgi:hypothetical protein
MVRVLFMTMTKTFYAARSGAYRYWFAPAHGLHHSVLKIQCSRAVMRAFTESNEGRNLTRFADVFEIGGGWYEVTSKDLTEWNEWFGSKADGAKMWMKAFNLSHIAPLNMNPAKFVIERVRHIDKNKVLTKPPVWMPTPEELRNRERLDSKMHALVNRFAKR